MSTTHDPLARVAEAREERTSSRRQLLGAAAGSAFVAGGLTLPFAEPAEAQRFEKQQTRSYLNNFPIEIPDNSNAIPYASPINVSGMVGGIVDISVAIYGLNHTSPEDVEIMLVSPTSVGKVIMAGAGGANAIAGVDLNFTDSVANPLPDATVIVSGNYRPTNYKEAGGSPGTSFGAPAPVPVLGQNFQAFRSLSGNNLNGTWRLFVKDATPNNFFGRIANGWGLGIITNIDEPIARNDSFVVRAGETLRVPPRGVLRNDNSRGGGELRLLQPVRKENRLGELLVQRNGALRFEARPRAQGVMRANYTVVDKNGLTAVARITIRVRP